MLRQILREFEQSEGAISLSELARRLGIAPSALEGMLEFLVRKGRLRVTGGAQACAACGLKGSCPFLVAEPKGYELLRKEGVQEE